MGATLVIDMMQVGVQGILAWSNYQTQLYALQQKRAAEGKVVTMEDILPLLDEAHTAILHNSKAINDALVAYNNS
jgi:ABC-type transport system involved in cytochrome c biogenesis ATPase subunit